MPLTKTEMVLNLIEGGGDWRDYTNADTDESETFAASVIADLFDDLGRPETITVTIEPGDRLNP